MSTLLLSRAAYLATFDAQERELRGVSLFARDGVIEAVGPPESMPANADATIDCSNLVLTPGLVNTHHHFFQTLTRCIPGAQETELFPWLQRLYPIWARLTPEALRLATMTAAAELLLSGCTTSADHTYIWPNGTRIEDEIEAAREMGLRLHAARGSMSVGESQGGLPPDSLVESEEAILADCERAIASYHDPARYAMTRVVLAPCSPFSVSPELMRETIALARKRGVHAHTHLAETADEERYCLERFGVRPYELAEQLGWTGSNVWYAHGVHLTPDECARVGATRTGIAHCPTSNMRLGSGIAPLQALLDVGARVALGVDGSASNDSSNMLDEARHAMLLQRLAQPRAFLAARTVLAAATRGGAAVLGRDDIGALAVGMSADVTGWRIDALELAGGAVHDPLAALLYCRPRGADLTVVNGAVRVRNGALVDFDLEAHVRRHNAIAREVLEPSF